MQYRTLGRTGVQVSSLVLGAMNFGAVGQTNLRSQLAAVDTVLSADVLDAIDELVAPGTDLAPEEKNDTPPSLLDSTRRRR
jgi:aryl-alcohol dehydrogenase-like predicted oxidoreductase